MKLLQNLGETIFIHGVPTDRVRDVHVAQLVALRRVSTDYRAPVLLKPMPKSAKVTPTPSRPTMS